MFCHACQTPLAPEARFCPSCGERAPTQADATSADPLRTALEKAAGARYELIRLLGRGGMGAVYLARETSLDRLVAIKVLPPESSGSPELRERFRREARTAARLTHPNIVPLHAFGEAEGTSYYVMGYVRGESLAARLRRDGRLAASDVRRLLAEVADALDYAHRQGVVHRDIKPDNVLLDDDSGRPMLADFGIAKAHGSGRTLTALGSVVGTPSYVSPEQASGKGTIDGRSDLYSLGVMGYQMVSGRLPFASDNPRDVLMQHLTKQAPPLIEVAPDAPSDLASAIMRCLAKDPESRWADGKSLRDALSSGIQDDAELPPSYRHVDGWGLRLVLSVLGFSYFALFVRLWGRKFGPVTTELVRLAWLLAGLWLLALLVSALSGARAVLDRGGGFREIAGLAFRQPGWWRSWYPRRLRRPGDVWARLPPVLKWPRATAGAAIVGFVLCVPPAVIVAGSPAFESVEWQHPIVMDWFRGTLLVGVIGPMLAFLAANIPMALWQRRHRVGSELGERLLIESTFKRGFWTRPQVAGLLLPAPASGSLPPRLPHDVLQAIAAAVRDLTGGAREAGARAVAVARELVSRIDTLDRAAAQLRRGVDPDEVARLEGRLAALGAESAGEDPTRQQMRQLLSQQREVALRLLVQVERKNAHRLCLVQALESLWGEVCALRAQGTPTPPGAGDRLFTLCERAEREAADDLGDLPGPQDIPTLEVPKQTERTR